MYAAATGSGLGGQIVNVLISALLGAGLAFVAAIGGVNAYQGDPQPVSQNNLYSYADE